MSSRMSDAGNMNDHHTACQPNFCSTLTITLSPISSVPMGSAIISLTIVSEAVHMLFALQAAQAAFCTISTRTCSSACARTIPSCVIVFDICAQSYNFFLIYANKMNFFLNFVQKNWWFRFFLLPLQPNCHFFIALCLSVQQNKPILLRDRLYRKKESRLICLLRGSRPRWW